MCIATFKILLNGAPGSDIQHCKGLRQGDPLSLLLFVLAIDPLQELLDIASERKILTKLCGKCTQLRLSLYADDATIFLNPIVSDVWNIKELMDNFGRITGLITNA
jgi:hypothetical protein